MAHLSDTSPEADRILTAVYRDMPLSRKWLNLGRDYHFAKVLHAAGTRMRHPSATPDEIRRAWVVTNTGVEIVLCAGEGGMEQPFENLQVLLEVIGRLRTLGIEYALGGSMASSIHGVNRFTRDADITAEPFPGKEQALVSSFGADYYVSIASVLEAVRRRSSFNIINTSTGFKVDVFIRKDTPFEQSAMSRRMELRLPEPAGETIALYTPEDTILFKLVWYRLGQEISDQQWRDILGVLKVKAGQLDEKYLDTWAADLGVGDLLARARQEALLPL